MDYHCIQQSHQTPDTWITEAVAIPPGPGPTSCGSWRQPESSVAKPRKEVNTSLAVSCASLLCAICVELNSVKYKKETSNIRYIRHKIRINNDASPVEIVILGV